MLVQVHRIPGSSSGSCHSKSTLLQTFAELISEIIHVKCTLEKFFIKEETELRDVRGALHSVISVQLCDPRQVFLLIWF